MPGPVVRHLQATAGRPAPQRDHVTCRLSLIHARPLRRPRDRDTVDTAKLHVVICDGDVHENAMLVVMAEVLIQEIVISGGDGRGCVPMITECQNP